MERLGLLVLLYAPNDAGLTPMTTRAPAPASTFTIHQLWAYALVVGAASALSQRPPKPTGIAWEGAEIAVLIVCFVGVLILHAFVLRYVYSLPGHRALGVGAAAGIVWTACGATTGAWQLVCTTMALLMLLALPITAWHVICRDLAEHGKAATAINLVFVSLPLLMLAFALASIVISR